MLDFRFQQTISSLSRSRFLCAMMAASPWSISKLVLRSGASGVFPLAMGLRLPTAASCLSIACACASNSGARHPLGEHTRLALPRGDCRPLAPSAPFCLPRRLGGNGGGEGVVLNKNISTRDKKSSSLLAPRRLRVKNTLLPPPWIAIEAPPRRAPPPHPPPLVKTKPSGVHACVWRAVIMGPDRESCENFALFSVQL